jgi:large subunit ribosomal protein L22
MPYGYAVKDINANRAHAVMMDVPISYKVAVLVGRKIQGMKASKAVEFLQAVQQKKRAVPYTKWNDSVGHKPGHVGPGRYPQKAAQLYEQLVKSVIANAEDRDLSGDLWVEFVVAQQASRPWRPGRVGRRHFKRSHVEIVVTDVPNAKHDARAARNAKSAGSRKGAHKDKSAAPAERVEQASDANKEQSHSKKETKAPAAKRAQSKEN